MSNKELAEELHKPIITKFNERKVHSTFTETIWAADLADIQLISKHNKEFKFLLCVIDIFSKYTWVTITNAFRKFLKESNCKPDKIWIDKESEFYNRSMKSWLEKNDIEMYSKHSKGKCVIGG